MEPSPLISRCLEPALGREQSNADAERESDAVDLLCLVAALAQYARFGAERLRARRDAHSHRVADTAERFFRECRSLYDDASAPVDEAPLRALGRECAGALVVPFSDHRKKGAAFVLETASQFAALAEVRLRPLWTTQTPTLRGALLHALVTMPETAPRLALEFLALDAHRRALAVSARRRHRPTGDRALFWSAAFLYAQADPQWDRKSAPPDVDDAETRRARTELCALADAASARMAALALARERLVLYRAEADPSELFAADEMDAALTRCMPHRFSLPQVVLDTFEAHCVMVDLMRNLLVRVEEEEAVVVEAPVAVVDAVVPLLRLALPAPPLRAAPVAAAVVEAPLAGMARRRRLARNRAREAERLRVEECADVLGMAPVAEDALQRASAVLLEEEESGLPLAAGGEEEEEDEDAKARSSVLRQMGEGRLPLEFKRTLLSVLACGFHRLVEPELECFVCFAPLDLAAAATGARFLMCCEGDFVCQACLQAGAFHRPEDGHAPRTELFPVLQAREVRRELGLLRDDAA